MRFTQELNDAFCQQILKELGNVSNYMQIHSYFEDLQLTNLSKFFLDRSNEEKTHADKFMKHINDRFGGRVTIGEVNEPNLNLSDPNMVGQEYQRLEQETTESIESIYELAFDQKSYMDLPFLLDMLLEQVSEEDESQKFAMNIAMVKDWVLFDATFGD